MNRPGRPRFVNGAQPHPFSHVVGLDLHLADHRKHLSVSLGLGDAQAGMTGDVAVRATVVDAGQRGRIAIAASAVAVAVAVFAQQDPTNPVTTFGPTVISHQSSFSSDALP